MNAAEKRMLSEEVKMQTAALKRLNCWKTAAFMISAIGVAFAYFGFAGTPQNLFCGIGGIAAMAAGFACAAILNLGLKNGRRNVEKMADALRQA